MWLHRLDEADASCGGKAVGLARLIAAGLPVPDGFVIDDRAFRHVIGDLDPASDEIGHALAAAADRIAKAELPEELVREVEARARELGVVAVRSSATMEDGDAGAASGVFSSKGDLDLSKADISELWTAIRFVWMSALMPLAVAYARRRGRPISIGVIIQRFVPGELVTIYTRPPNGPTIDQMLVQRGATLERVSRGPARSVKALDENSTNAVSTDSVQGSSIAGLDPVVELALRAEIAIGAIRGADVELVEAAGPRPEVAGGVTLWVVQARLIVHRPVAQRRAAPPSVIAPLVADGRTWKWDVAHNPDPLSPAQASLVECVDRAKVSPRSLRVCAGFLYTARREEAGAHEVVAPTTIAALDARVRELEAAMEAALGAEVSSLADAIERYVAFYAIWATELAPLIAAARANLSPAQLTGARPSAVEASLLAAARGEIGEQVVIDRIGVMSPAWDVSVPTFAERPELVRDAIHRAHHHARAVAADAERDLARAAADLAERDDVWFARAQWLVRSAILERARELAIDAHDAFWIPLDELAAATELDADDVRRRASGARAAAERAAQWAMPIVVGGPPADPDDPAGPILRGVGTGPRITGRVVRFETLAQVIRVSAGDIVVTRAVTPALAVLVIGCAALVSETGGLLDHGAALARELGIPCVVGCRDAWQLVSGAVVTVDGDAGTVEVGIR